MTNCVDCKNPPGGQACCPDGLTPMCFIRDGKANTHCIKIPAKVSGNETLFRNFLVNSIIGLAGGGYASEVQERLSISDGFAEFSSIDGRIHVTAQKVASGSLGSASSV